MKKLRTIVAKAFNYWSKYAELNFKECTNCKSDFVIDFGQDNHGDDYPFDGEGKFQFISNEVRSLKLKKN